MNTSLSPYEARLVREIEEIEVKIRDLNQESNALKRQLMKARWENSSLRDVSRKNSANRVMVEQRILGALAQSARPMKFDKLFEIARLTNFELRDNTFRTQLHRMKAKGMIESAGWGTWRLQKASPLD